MGVGRLLFPPPQGGDVISWLCIVVGLVLIPFWLKILLSKEQDLAPEDEPMLLAEEEQQAGRA